MSLSTQASHPSRRSYVLKLHRDATPESGLLFGRLENIATGHCFVFGSVAELLRCLASDTARGSNTAPPVTLDGVSDPDPNPTVS
ncbi:hypothetical protein [Azohydromonas australica]|uniref:hypothetical protein n=1 Tax=Azohydromonas australica TaxID=364039 RepID=UPI000426C6B5|nr:hypothetical protein [Azohydromonas australica]